MSTNHPHEGRRELIHLEAGEAQATVDLAHGGRLASLAIRGRELLIGPPAPPDGTIRWGLFLMAPWPGRLAEGRLRWEGRSIQLPRTHGRHAIHGLVHNRAWTPTRTSAGGIVMETDLVAAGWPFHGRVEQAISLEREALRLEAVIEAREAMPAALGWHPWFDRGESDPHVTVTSDRVLAMRGMIPTGAQAAVAGHLDLRAGPPLGRRRLDDAYTGVRSPAVIGWPDLTIRLELDPILSTVVVHTPARAFCVAPQTAWPTALGHDAPLAARQGAVRLAAGERLAASVLLRWS